MGRKKKKNDNSRTYLKVYATFKCSRAECGKIWNSAHAWDREEKLVCDFCGKNVQVSNCVDEFMELDIYCCPSANCDNRWESIHDGSNDDPRQECDGCGALVTPNGTQQRFGRHFFFICSNGGCGIPWEDFSLQPQHTQRCTKCKSRGDIVKVVKLRWPPPRRGKKGDGESDIGGGGGGAGKHNYEHCDMCAAVKGGGLAGSCIPLRKVMAHVSWDGNQEYERIVRAE